MAGVEAEVGAPILQEDPRSFGHNTSPKTHIQTIDKRAGVAGAIHNAQVNGVRAGQRQTVGGRRHGPLPGDEPTPPGGVLLAQQSIHRRGVRVHIRHVTPCIGEGQPHGFDHQVQALWCIPGHLSQVPAFRDVECQQCRDTLPVGGTFMDRHPSIIGLDRLVPG